MYYYTEDDNRLFEAQYAAREQYDEGYKKGYEDGMLFGLIKCKDCVYFENRAPIVVGICKHPSHKGSNRRSKYHYCAYAVEREECELE